LAFGLLGTGDGVLFSAFVAMLDEISMKDPTPELMPVLIKSPCGPAVQLFPGEF
jgi:hypothetical protein